MPKKGKRRARRSRPAAIAGLSLEQIRSELNRRHQSLLDHRANLEAELNSLNTEIEQYGTFSAGHKSSASAKGQGQGRGRRDRGRGGNKASLPVLLHGLLIGKTMSVPEMAEAAKKAGHVTKSKNFRTIVSLAMITHRDMFKRVSRGMYTAK